MRLPSLVAWINFFVPLIAVIGAYSISIHQELQPACIPLWDGCTSISRAARYGDALFLFRGLMMPMAMLLVVFWIFQWRWLNQLAGVRKRHHAILGLGIVSALALVLYANYLGSDGDFYRFMRTFGVTFYFAFALLAQLISLQSLFSLREALDPALRRPLRIQWILVCLQWGWGGFSLWVDATQTGETRFEWQNIVEWNFAWAMTGFYAVSGWIWWHYPPRRIDPTTQS